MSRVSQNASNRDQTPIDFAVLWTVRRLLTCCRTATVDSEKGTEEERPIPGKLKGKEV